MYKKQIVAVLFSIILLSGITGTFSPNLAHAATDKTLEVGVIFVNALGKCTDRNKEALENYVYITSQYLTKYNIKHSYPSALCINSDQLSYWIEEIDKTNQLDLIVIIPDIINSIQWLEAKYRAGHYFNNGNQNYIVSEALSLKVESKSSTWVLSHELSHFALFWKEYPYDVWANAVHTTQAAYDRCTSEDATGAFCPNLWTTIQTKSGNYFPVMQPLYTENYKSQTTSSSTPTNNVQTQNTPKLKTTIEWSWPNYDNNKFRFFDVGENIVLTGKLFAIRTDNTAVPLTGAKVSISDYNNYKTPQKEYKPFMGDDTTDSSGEFRVSWNAIEHTGAIWHDNDNWSLWTPIARYAGSQNYEPITQLGNQFFVKKLPKIIDSDNDGILDNVDNCIYEAENFNSYQDSDGCPDSKPVESNPTSKSPGGIVWVEQTEYMLPDSGVKPVIISGKVYGSHEGEKIEINVKQPSGIAKEHYARVSNGVFTTTYYLDKDSRTGEYTIFPHFTEGNTVYWELVDFYVKESPTSESEIKSTKFSDNGKIWLEQYEYELPIKNFQEVTINGEVEGDHDGEIVNIMIEFPDRNTYAKEQFIIDGKFSLVYIFSPDSLAGTYTIVVGQLGKTSGKYVVFDLVTFEMKENKASSQKTFIAEATEIQVETTSPSQYELDRDRAIAMIHTQQKLIEQLESRIKTAENSLSGLQYQSQESQQKIKDAWSVRWMAIQKLDDARAKWNTVYNDLIQYGKFNEALVLLEEIDSLTKGVDNDLNWIPTAINDAEKLEKEHKSQDFLAFALDSGEGKTCIWFICW